MGVNYAPNVVRNGLVLYLDAANAKSYPGSGTTWTDLSGNGNNSTLTNGPTFNSANNGSIVFDGTNDCAVQSSLSAFNVNCINIWFKPTSTINSSLSGRSLLTLRYTGVSNSEWYLGLGNITSLLTNEYFSILSVSNGERTGLTDGGSFPAGTWVNVCCNSESGRYAIYVNGASKTVTAGGNGLVSTLTNPNKCSIAVLDGATPSVYSDVTVGQLQLYSVSLSASQITQNFNATRSRYGL